ncbi:MAG: PSD1 domain-containing protein [Planctomycetaceae bacterium]|nr:PSD1 domain-containing protein [Planctomycetaceae bacterium]
MSMKMPGTWKPRNGAIPHALVWLTLLLTFLQLTSNTSFATDQQPKPVRYVQDIQPLLSRSCFTCHGPDATARKAGLRLDTASGATTPADSGSPAIVPGHSDNSTLLERISTDDDDLRMPPPESGDRLTGEQVAMLRQWIADGAEYQSHWAFVTPSRPAVPPGDRSENPVDLFVREQLEASGLKPTAPATRETLIRRLSLDLTGLPPTPQEVSAFLADDSPNAYEKVVDRLLASPHYGERMAIRWLDQARFADSNGFQSDGSRDIWAWRDWVIHAYNQNMPFDQFTIEQLAGDMLPAPTRSQIIATGFNRNHRLNGEGGRIVEEWFVETVIDRVETTGLTWLGLTLNCCRCHEHKYDPISQREFYQLFAFFNSVEESGVLSPQGKNGENTPPLYYLSTPETDARVAELEQVLANARERVAEVRKAMPALQTEWEATALQQLKEKKPVWNVASVEVTSRGGATLTIQPDGSWLASGKNPPNDTYEIRIPLSESVLTGLMIETLPDAGLPAQSLGRGFNGNFVLTGVTAQLSAPELSEPVPVTLTDARADYEQAGWTAESIRTNEVEAAAGESQRGWAIDGNDPAKRLTRRLMFRISEAGKIPPDAVLQVRLFHQSQYRDHNVGRFRISVSSASPELVSLNEAGLPSLIQQILAVPADQRTTDQKKSLTNYFAASVPNGVSAAESAIKDAQAALTDYRDRLPTTMVMKETTPRDAWVLVRGQYDKPGEKVERGTPAMLPPMKAGLSMDRLGLAQWIVDRENPLTARVWVNREWERFFGTGFVRTTENLGTQSDFPSHPELLDWLAVEFMQPTVLPDVNDQPAHAWDMKALQKLIVMSRTYQQSSAVTPDRLEADPENRLLSRGPRFRLTGELIRDQALAISGLLVPTVGGPSVRPYMPEGVWDETSKYGNLRNYKHDQGDGLYRRTIYTIWKRTAAPPTMLLFDAPNREVCTIKRSRTNTPLQALALLNEVTFVEAARGLAFRMMTDGGSTNDSRLEHGFRLATGRHPSDREKQVLLQGWEQDLADFRNSPDSARQLLSIGHSAVNDAVDQPELAAWTVTANVLLNLDEVVMRE